VVNNSLRHGWSGVDSLVDGGQGSGDGSVADGAITSTSMEVRGSGLAQGDEN